MPNETELSRFKQKLLLRDRPLRKAGLIRWLLPEIDAALQNGYTIVELHTALSQAGIKLHYKLLSAYIRAARAEKKKQSAVLSPPLPTSREQATPAPQPAPERAAEKLDPLRNFYDMESKMTAFKYTPPTLADKDKLI